MNRQEYYRKEYKKMNPTWMDSMNIYKKKIAELVSNQTKILDIGCGHGDFLKDVYDKTPFSYGIDTDKAALDKNTFIKHKVVGTAEKLPFKDNFFDVVVSAWVLEHLDNPKEVFKEIYRVLKPGGKVIFLTPNAWNYNVWIIRIIPNRFHAFFTQRLYGRKENDTYPVRYRINSEKKCDRILLPLGFQKTEFIVNGDPSYISFNKTLFWFACLLETVLSHPWLHFAKVHLIGIYQK